MELAEESIDETNGRELEPKKKLGRGSCGNRQQLNLNVMFSVTHMLGPVRIGFRGSRAGGFTRIKREISGPRFANCGRLFDELNALKV